MMLCVQKHLHSNILVSPEKEVLMLFFFNPITP